MSKGELIYNGVHLTEAEKHTINILLNEGYNIELVQPSDVKDTHNPDILINNIYWEIKAPVGKSKNTIRHNLKRAEKQSRNVIIDLYRCGLTEFQAMKDIKRVFYISKHLQKLKVITKQQKILDFSKK